MLLFLRPLFCWLPFCSIIICRLVCCCENEYPCRTSCATSCMTCMCRRMLWSLMQPIALLLLALVTGKTEERWFILFPTSRLSMIAVYLSVDFVCFYASFEPAVVWFPIGLLYTAPVDLLHMNSTARIYGIRRLLVCPIGNLQSTKRNKKKEFCFYSIYHTFFKNKQFTFPFFVLLYLRPLFRWVCVVVAPFVGLSVVVSMTQYPCRTLCATSCECLVCVNGWSGSLFNAADGILLTPVAYWGTGRLDLMDILCMPIARDECVSRACQHSNRLMAWKSSTRIITR